MPKTVKLIPLNQSAVVQTNGQLLSALLGNDLKVMQECGGRGMCATCHVFVREGSDGLSPINRREQRTLQVITTCQTGSRLACQARVMGEGVVVEVPPGMYVNAIDDLESLVGRRAQDDLLHPLTGEVLVEEGKLITRSILVQLQEAQIQAAEYLSKTEDA
jgi:ferredoxin